MKTEFSELPVGAKFKHGKSSFVKMPDPFTGTSIGGMRVRGNNYHWKHFEENKLVERIDVNV